MPPAGTALQRLKDAQRAREHAGNPGQRRCMASSSDADNEAYIQKFDEAFSSMSTAAPGHRSASAALTTTTAAAKASRPDADMNEPITKNALARSSKVSSTVMAAGEAGLPARSLTAARPSWQTRPLDEAGVLVPLSDGPVLCSAANWSSNEVVLGSSDHALYVVDAAAGKKRRTLYSKTTGHTEWVTCVCCLPGGRVLSGGMDGQLWLWPAAGSAGCEIQAAHAAPVSKVACLTPAPPTGSAAGISSSTTPGLNSSSDSRIRSSAGVRLSRAAAAAAAAGPVLAVSCSYDRTVKVWDVTSGRGKQVAVLQGHAGPVLELAVHPGGRCIATGDRKGCLMCWDLDSGSSCWGVAAAHQGHISALTWSAAAAGASAQDASDDGSCCAISGGQDGVVRVWDGRTSGCVAEQAVHVGKKGRGAVSNIVTGCGSSGNLVVTAGADMTLRVLDAAQSCKLLHTVQLTDFPYSLTAVASYLVLCGCGDGSAHVVDVEAGKVLYVLRAGKAAVRAMEVSPAGDRLLCAGDDGCAVCFEFR